MANPSPDAGSDRITGLLREASAGRREALDELMPLVYDRLRRLASARLRHEAPYHTLETTGLVHEAWLRLINQHRVHWQDRRHFYAVASEVMRRILVDHARRRGAAKRGGPRSDLSLEAAESVPGDLRTSALDDVSLLALDAALHRLAEFSPDGAKVVEMRFFSGLSHAETAEMLGSSERTVRRIWNAARAWLRREVQRELL